LCDLSRQTTHVLTHCKTQVGHGADAFEAGETRILTLADRGVLDGWFNPCLLCVVVTQLAKILLDKGRELNDEEDMLIDIHIAERELKAQNDEKRKQKPKYDPQLRLLCF
jgi:hypothetical protein